MDYVFRSIGGATSREVIGFLLVMCMYMCVSVCVHVVHVIMNSDEWV